MEVERPVVAELGPEIGARIDAQQGPVAGGATGTRRPGLAWLRGVLGLQIVLGLVWGIAMLFFAPLIVLGDPHGPHIEKIAMEGGAHLMLVLAACLVWRAPQHARDVLWLMVFLNGVWTLTDLVYIPLVHLTMVDFYVKLAVNAALTVGLVVAGRRTGIL